jgi:hypothetical protein
LKRGIEGFLGYDLQISPDPSFSKRGFYTKPEEPFI